MRKSLVVSLDFIALTDMTLNAIPLMKEDAKKLQPLSLKVFCNLKVL